MSVLLSESLNLRSSLISGLHSAQEESICLQKSTRPQMRVARSCRLDFDDGHYFHREAADIIIATPGRLVSALRSSMKNEYMHLTADPFETCCDQSLYSTVNPFAFLQFLVIDEVDRLLRQSYQGWLETVLKYIHRDNDDQDILQKCDIIADNAPRCVKILVSATLTRDPVKIDRLRLSYPLYIADVDDDNDEDSEGDIAGAIEKYSHQLPTTLTQYKLVTAPANKPLALLTLLVMFNTEGGSTPEDIEGKSTIIFTGSLETSHKLSKLLSTMHSISKGKALAEDVNGSDDVDDEEEEEEKPGVLSFLSSHAFSSIEFSSSMTHTQRAKALEKFKSGECKIMIASDAATRGIDIQNVDIVVNYDAPVFARTYIHRVGRTARMGKQGIAVTVMAKHEVRHFKSIVRKNSSSTLINFTLDYSILNSLREPFEHTMTHMSELDDVERETKDKTFYSVNEIESNGQADVTIQVDNNKGDQSTSSSLKEGRIGRALSILKHRIQCSI